MSEDKAKTPTKVLIDFPEDHEEQVKYEKSTSEESFKVPFSRIPGGVSFQELSDPPASLRSQSPQTSNKAAIKASSSSFPVSTNSPTFRVPCSVSYSLSPHNTPSRPTSNRNLEGLDSELQSLKQKVWEADFNNPEEKVKLYSLVELLKLKYEDTIFSEIGEAEGDFRDSKTRLNERREKIEEWQKMKQYSELQELKERLFIKPKRVISPLDIVRNIAASIFHVFGGITLFLLLPLRFLHPILRKFGVQNNYLPVDLVQKLYCHILLLLLGIEVRVEGLESVEDASPSIYMFNHRSSLDSFVFGVASPVSCKMVGKRAIFWLPIFGWLALEIGAISIDRSNLQKAVASFKEAARRMKVFHRSLAVSPEGGRSKIGHLMEFKKGPFHLSKQALRDLGELKIRPVIIFGTYELLPPKTRAAISGEVVVRFLPPIYVDCSWDIDVVASKVRKRMLEELTNPPVLRRETGARSDNVLFLFLSWFLVGLMYLLPAYFFNRWFIGFGF